MSLDLDRILQLIEDESVDLPPISMEQAIAANRLFDAVPASEWARGHRGGRVPTTPSTTVDDPRMD